MVLGWTFVLSDIVIEYTLCVFAKFEFEWIDTTEENIDYHTRWLHEIIKDPLLYFWCNGEINFQQYISDRMMHGVCGYLPR